MIPPPPLIHVSLRVADVEGAMRFYAEAMDGDWAITTTPGARARASASGQVLILILPEDAQPPEYEANEKGRVPRLELQSHDVRVALERFVRAGGQELCCLGDPPSYAQALDPYGHLWSFCDVDPASDDEEQVTGTQTIPPPLVHVSVRVADVEAATRFYDLAIEGDWAITMTPAARGRTLCDGRVLLLVLPEDAQPPEYESDAKGRMARLHIECKDVGAALARFVRAGGKEENRRTAPPEWASALDPYGHKWVFANPARKEESSVISDTMTVMARMALAHLAAEHVLPVLAGRPATHALVAELIEVGWSWMRSRKPDPEFIYWTYNPRLMEDGTHSLGDKHVVPALFSALDMHYLMVRLAEWVTSIEQPNVVLSIGNDINEVGPSVLDDCLRHALEASPRPELTERWLSETTRRLAREYPARREITLIGEPIDRAAFPIPRLDR
jgi:predicted enzyme related to lactoylglutathione lyase